MLTGEASTTAAFSITRSMVEQFATISGDRSSLHLDSDFAKTTQYRDNLVHGMIPIAMTISEFYRRSGSMAVSLSKIRAKFLTPLRVGDSFTITFIANISDDSNEINFEIVNCSDHQVATRGLFQISSHGEAPLNSAPSREIQVDCICANLDESCFYLDEISKGSETEIDIKLTNHALEAFRRLLNFQQLTDIQAAQVGLLSSLSTLVGMKMPGRTATFQDFQLDFTNPHSVPRILKLHGNVSAVSAAVNAIHQTIKFLNSERAVVASGKIGVGIKKRPVLPPQFTEINEALAPKLGGRVALVSGASRGLGAVIAKALAASGCRVVVNYFSNKAAAEAVVDDIIANHGKAMALQADVSNPDAVNEMLSAIEASPDFRTVDILVNNAVARFQPCPFSVLKWDTVAADLSVVLGGAFHLTKCCAPHMIDRKFGRIINISTVATISPPEKQLAYVVAKSALDGFTRALAVELAAHGILVNTIAPGMMETDLIQGVPNMVLSAECSKVPLKRLTTPLDVAKAVVHLASAQSDFTTGQRVVLNGGLNPFS